MAREESALSSEAVAWMATAIGEARAAWPNLVAGDEAFGAHLAAKVTALGESADFRALRVGDLYFAFACQHRGTEAVSVFETRYAPLVERAIARLKLDPATTADLGAQIREMLFFGIDGGPPLFGDYGGRGELGGWLRSIAVRLAFKHKKREGRLVAADALGDLSDDANPELAYLRRAHAAAFERALAAALGRLEVRERNLLRQHYLDGLNLDALGRLYKVHRATAARWIAEARGAVLTDVRNTLAASMSPSELESFFRATRGELGLRLSTILKIV